MAINFYGATALTGGSTGALDSIDGANLNSADGAIVITSAGVYIYYLNASSGAGESSPDIIAPDSNAGNKRWILQGIAKFYINDTDGSHQLQLKWNEDDSADRVFNIKVNSGDRTLDLSENLTLANGYNLTLTVEDAASAVVFDNVNFEVENTDGTQRTVKITSAKAGNTVLTLQENLTIGDGYDVTITAEDAAGAITLDNANFEVEASAGSGKTIKFTNNGVDASRTVVLGGNLTVGDPSANECNLAAASNADIDTGTETVDSFADTLGEGAVWFYVVIDNDDATNRRAGQVMAAWDATNDTIEYTETSTLDVGTTDVTLAVDIDSNTVRLRATAGSDNWTVRCQRMVL